MSKIGYDVLFGNCLETMNAIEDESIDTCITSPPYYGLRDYGTAEWEGGDPNCEHTVSMDTKWNDPKRGKNVLRPEVAHRGGKSNACLKCDATRIDEQIGLEDTPEKYIENLVEIFRLVKRKLKPTGTLWLNIGDSYAGSNQIGRRDKQEGGGLYEGKQKSWSSGITRSQKRNTGLKPKDLIGIPWMLAFALRADGWYLRQDIIWSKPNCMPESVRDRCTKSHEYIFLLTKSKSYFYDHEAIKEPVKGNWGTRDRTEGKYHNEGSGLTPHSGLEKNYTTKNKRSVWTIPPKPYKEAHFAVFPPDLVEPCIRAGSSQYGCCADCGEPYIRNIEMEKNTTHWKEGRVISDDHLSNDFSQSGKKVPRKDKIIIKKSIDKGWIKNCECEQNEIIPSVVLDPFGGSGTTAGVAIKNRRRAILCELNEDYIDLMEDRIASISNGWRPGQLTLGDF